MVPTGIAIKSAAETAELSTYLVLVTYQGDVTGTCHSDVPNLVQNRYPTERESKHRDDLRKHFHLLFDLVLFQIVDCGRLHWPK